MSAYYEVKAKGGGKANLLFTTDVNCRELPLCPQPGSYYTFRLMDMISLIGLFAAACTTLAFLPQLLKSWRTRQTRDISIGWLVLLAIGLSTWIVYGVLRHDMVIIVANVATIALVLILFGLKIKYK